MTRITVARTVLEVLQRVDEESPMSDQLDQLCINTVRFLSVDAVQ